MRRSGRRAVAAAIVLAVALPAFGRPAGRLVVAGENPDPVHLVRPPAAPLSAMARIGESLFHDQRLSASGRMSCASCHDPDRHFGPPGGLPAMFGGVRLRQQGMRAVPTLTYLERQRGFSIGPDTGEDDAAGPVVTPASLHGQAPKTATDTAVSAAAVVPQGGMFWDGRVDTLQDQALVPLLNPIEMANPSVAALAARLRHDGYAKALEPLVGRSVLHHPRALVAEAMFAIARFQIESPSLHPYTSKFDYWLEGKVRLSPPELRGYLLFNDPRKANCGGCHLDRPPADGTPPRFTDGQYEALGVPRNPALAVNRDPTYFDLGLCGPLRRDLREQTQYCGMFLTPTLRNVATRTVFFHNGVYHTLKQVLDFYNFRDVQPGRVYPRRPDGRVDRFDDLPARFRGNIDVVDPPFNRWPGEQPAMTGQDERDIIAFLNTLTDGYRVQPSTGSGSSENASACTNPYCGEAIRGTGFGASR